MFKYIVAIYAIFSSSISSVHAMDITPFDTKRDGFSAFKGLTPKRYIEQCMPGLAASEQQKATKIFQALAADPLSPILEGTIASTNNNNKVLPEGGYSFPPIMEIQGPLLSNCAQNPLKHVMNIGPGNGADDIMMLCTNNVQIIAADIYKDQLNQLKERVKCSHGSLSKEKFFAHIKNYAEDNIKIPEAFKNGFEVINANKMLHFLTGKETKTFLKNMDTLLKKRGRFYLTVSTPTPYSPDDAHLKMHKALKSDCPGLIYYDIIRLNGAPPECKILPNGAPELPGPAHKIEYVTEKGNTRRQGRHYHDIDTLTPYLAPYFHILDSVVINYGASYFLSVIAEKK